MTPLAATALVFLGLLLLAGGGEALVRGATALARLAGLTPAVIGLTVVAVGTSLPELVVSIFAALGGQPDIAVGNVVGSNIFNVVGVLGITALITVVPVHGTAVKLEWPFMFVASCGVVLLARDGLLDRLEAGFLLVSLVLFIGFMVRLARREVAGAEQAEFEAEVAQRTLRAPRARGLLALGAVAGGIVLLVLGGRALVLGAVELARLAGMTERVIGLTVVAIGTSMPEVAASVMAALRGRTDVAVANLIGSNIFNLLGILGITALIQPVPVSAAMLSGDMVWMLLTAFALFPILRTGMRVSRLEGAILLAIYAAYLGVLLGG
ncbi:MAG: calcium/sodium antiporter [Gemmatimonadetes bacterium]|nr:calcium/sodium antiporter [Gemmatimonadota bacterium]